MSTQTLRELVKRHIASTTILATLGAALDAYLTETPLDPALQLQISEVFGAVEAPALPADMSQTEMRHLLAEIRFHTLLDSKLLFGATRSVGWAHNEAEILQAGGEVAAGFAEPLTRLIVPQLAGLAQRFVSSDAAFLDVGVGAAGLAIALAQRWPALTVVGIDPWSPALALARANVRQAELTDRIQLRQQAVEEVTDTRCFDLVWLPSAFLPSQVIATAIERAHRALRPGGWLLFAMVNRGVDPLMAALVRLRTTFWGGSLLEPSAVERDLRQVGFVEVRTLPTPPGSLITLIAAQRAPA